ncbi:hypothetical protein FKW77_006289 [Venturia effusa]|uniref:Secreted protein n=1 Tax=Venturia effusa TaxID=50376 RepID=A0A517LCK4_9PEZI|nr:hypothetical protein FKW77_006289 [Venturia effusa]
MHFPVNPTALLILLLPMLATTVNGKCPSDTDGWNINGVEHCLQRGPLCVEMYAEFNFKGPSFTRCSVANECVTIPHDSGAFGKVSSFREQGKTGFPNKNLKTDQLKCGMFYEDNCKPGSDHGSVDSWNPNFQEQKCWKGAGVDNRLKSYRCWKPLNWHVPKAWDCSGP